MRSKKFIRLGFVVFVFVTAFVGVVNYVVDPYGYNNFLTIKSINEKKNSNTSMTARFKSNLLIRGGFNAILLGTSRVGVMNPEIVNKYLNTNTFNLEYPGSNTEIHNKFFIYASYFNDIKYLIYGIDFMSFNKNRNTKNDFKEFYDLQSKIENFEKTSNYELYFNMNTFLVSVKLVIKNLTNNFKTESLYRNNGMRDYIDHIEELKDGTLTLDKNIQKSIQGYFKPDTGIYKNYDFSYEFLDYFEKTIKYCKTNNIELFVYIPPMYSEHFDALASADYFDKFELFKKEIVQVTNFIDFTGHNSITKNKNNYWDSSHLRVEITEIIMAKIFNDKSVNVPDDFGVLVTKQNIDEHLQNLRKQIKNYDLNKTLAMP